ncbi:MAG TPA: LamG-like jellyroll fold domain-containing protein [Blastocatellia bacterium]
MKHQMTFNQFFYLSHERRGFNYMLTGLLFGLLVLSLTAQAQTWSQKPSLTKYRYGAAAATGPDGRVYLIGGKDNLGNLHQTVEVYDPLAETWTTLSANLPTPRVYLAAVTGRDGYIYTFGGLVAGGQPSNVFERYDLTSKQWMTMPVMPFSAGLVTATVLADGRICVAGNATKALPLPITGFFSNVHAYNPKQATWQDIIGNGNYSSAQYAALVTGLDGYAYQFDNAPSTVKFDGSAWDYFYPSPSTNLIHFAGLTGPNGRFYLLGGHSGFPSTSALSTVLDKDDWDPMAPLPAPTYLLAAAAAEGDLLAMGGIRFASQHYANSNYVFAYGPLAAPEFRSNGQSNRVAFFRFEDFQGVGIPDDNGTLFSGGGSNTKDDSANLLINEVKGYAASAGRVNSTKSNLEYASFRINSEHDGTPVHRGDFMRVNDHPSLNFGTGSFTIEGWIQINRNTGLYTLLDKRKALGGGKYLGYHLFFNAGGKLGLQLANGSSYVNYVATQAVPLASQTQVLGGWTHIAVSVERGNGVNKVSFYINGVLAGEFPALVGDINSPGVALNIGRHNFNSGTFFGALDDLAFYNRSLNWPEVRAIFLAGRAGKQ